MQNAIVKNRVAEFRKKMDWTQEDLALHANVGQSTISEIENDKGLPYIDTALFLSSAMKCTLDDLFYLETVLPDHSKNS